MNADPARSAVVLVSGGLDSTTALAVAASEGYDLYVLTLDYGQRHRLELDAADRVAHAWRAVEHRRLRLDLASFGGSALIDAAAAVPKDRDIAAASGIPPTYVPARNTILLSLALAWAEVIPAANIFLGVNALDYSGYPDCRPEFIAAFEQLANLATKAGITGEVRFRIHAPLISLTKRQIVELGSSLGVDYGMTFSCYDPTAGAACGRCDACQLRLRGFAEAGLRDPAVYAAPGGTEAGAGGPHAATGSLRGR